jgi:2'-5' RNA ligase
VSVRTFVALELSEAAKAGILSVIRELDGRGIRASWSRDSTIHLTLKFLGDVDEVDLPGVVDAVREAASAIRPFTMRTRGLGAFPSRRRPRIIWAGMAAPDELYDLQAGLERALGRLGFDRERRRFRPHVTLGRLRENDPRVEALLEELQLREESTDVDSVSVMKSTLERSGAVHEVVAEIPLGTS